LYIGGLDDGVNEDLIRAAFIPFGEILSVNFTVDAITKKHRGFAFVEYETIEDANAAVDNMHNSELLGKIITCATANPTTISAKGKPIWADENLMDQIATDSNKEGNSEKIEDKPSKISTSEVVVNAPKKQKTGNENKLPPTPHGFPRCKGCGGFGVALVKENGYCMHCQLKGIAT